MGKEGGAEICPMHCSQIVCASAFLAHLIPPLTLLLFPFSLRLPPNDIRASAASPTDLPVCGPPPPPPPLVGDARVGCRA